MKTRTIDIPLKGILESKLEALGEFTSDIKVEMYLKTDTLRYLKEAILTLQEKTVILEEYLEVVEKYEEEKREAA